MAERTGPVEQLDRYFAAATIAHEYIFDLHRELTELHADSADTRELLGEAAVIVLARMPELARELLHLERRRAEQELLDPHQAMHTMEAFRCLFAEVEPGLAMLRARQDEIVAELADLIDQARGAE